MKKLLALILVMVMVFSITACSKDNDTHKSSDKSSTKDEVSATKDTVDIDDSDEKDTSNKPVSNDKDEENSESSDDFCLGTVNGNVYENEFIGIGFEADDGSVYMSREELIKMNDTVDNLMGEDYTAVLQQTPTIYDMYVVNAEQTGYAIVNVAKVESKLMESLDVKDRYKLSLPYLEEKFDEMGAESFNFSFSNCIIDGVEFPSLMLKIGIRDIVMIEQLFSIKCDGYIANIACTAISRQVLEELMNNFYLIK